MAASKNQLLNTKIQRACAWSGLVGVIIFFMGFVIPGWIPLPPPSMTQEQVVAMYQQNLVNIRIGGILFFISSIFLPPMVAVISIQLKRIEGANPILAYTQLSAGSINIVFFIATGLLFLMTAFRPDRPPELIYLMNDISWFVAVMVWPAAFTQNIAIAVAILNDQSDEPIFPRWVGFFNIWASLLFIPGSLVPFFTQGPFAWSGIIGFWVPATAFGIWFLVMLPMLLRAIKHQATGYST